MCGINLILDKKQRLQSDEAISKMVAATRHRGPDSESWLRIEKAGADLYIGNSRLRILDLSPAGRQPMQCSERGATGNRYTLSYNGELYNHFELKNELLQKGYRFHSTTDTEVLLYALSEWGEAILDRLEGMFAFIFYDKAEGLLLMARDPRGMKPLYYSENEQFLLASSELQSLFASDLLKKELNEAQVYHYLQFRYAQKPNTFFRQVYELLPGQQFTYQSGQEKPLIKAYRQTNSAPSDQKEALLTEKALSEKVEELLTDALFSHLHSDRPTGLFLSGGVDSTLMLALLRDQGSNYLPLCYTIANSRQEANWGTKDYVWATRAAKQYDAQHIAVSIDADVLQEFPSFIAAQDQPIGDSAAWLTSILSRQAARQVQVVLSGAGADELFGGYNRHRAFYTYLKHHQQLRWMLPALKPLSAAFSLGSFTPLRKPLRLWNKLLRQTSSSPGETFINYLSFHSHSSPEISLQKEAGDFIEGWMQAALQHDRQHFLISDILALNDKAAMQHSLEMRMPYLDQKLWTFASSLPASKHLQQGRKWLLGDILSRHGGKAYVKRRKEGFGMPFGLWVREGKTDFLWEWLQEKDHPIHRFLPNVQVQNFLHLHTKGREDYSQELFSLTVLAHWLKKEFS
jgi:asparagine synthase (glutamine-hydrolysing)